MGKKEVQDAINTVIAPIQALKETHLDDYEAIRGYIVEGNITTGALKRSNIEQQAVDSALQLKSLYKGLTVEQNVADFLQEQDEYNRVPGNNEVAEAVKIIQDQIRKELGSSLEIQ